MDMEKPTMQPFPNMAIPKKLSFVLGVLFVSLLASPRPASSQTRTVSATIDTTKTGATISKSIYGQFLEHGGDIVNTGIWSEMLVDRKTLAIAGINPSDAEQSIQLTINGAKLASSGHLYRMASDSINATVQVDKKPELHVENQALGALPATVTVRPFSVNIYSYPVQ